MLYNLLFCLTFKLDIERIFKSFPKSKNDIQESVHSLADNLRGDAYPGFQSYTLKKMRIALPKYKRSARDGLRFVYLLLKDKEKIVPLHIYEKGFYKKEHDVKRQVKRNLKEILEEIESDDELCDEKLDFAS